MAFMEQLVWERFQKTLDEHHQWPTPFTFKFIAPLERAEELKRIFENRAVRTRPSTKGNYISITCEYTVQSSSEVVAIYQAASRIPGIMAL